MRIAQKYKKDSLVCCLSGEISIDTAGTFKKFFKDLIQKKERKIILNFADVEYIDSVGMSVLIEFAKDLKKIEGIVFLSNLSSKIGSIFAITRSALLKTAMTISLTHHEKFDGTGYPNGLKGKEIPLFGRIVSLADVFDALTSKRPYKDELGFNEAIAMVKRQSGIYFDPDIVKAFLKRKSNIKKIWQATHNIELSILDEINNNGA